MKSNILFNPVFHLGPQRVIIRRGCQILEWGGERGGGQNTTKKCKVLIIIFYFSYILLIKRAATVYEV